MSQFVKSYIHCDSCGKETSLYDDLEFLIRHSEDAGWRIFSPQGKDYCPPCWEKQKGEG